MRTWVLAAACSILLVSQDARGEEKKTASNADEEIAQSQATLAESAAATGPSLERGKPHKASAWPWIFGGVGAAGVVTGGIFALASLSEQSKADDFSALATRSNNPNERTQLEANAQDSGDSADRSMTIGLIAGGAGLGLLAIGIVWAIVDSPSTPKLASITPLGLTATF